MDIHQLISKTPAPSYKILVSVRQEIWILAPSSPALDLWKRINISTASLDTEYFADSGPVGTYFDYGSCAWYLPRWQCKMY